MPGSKLGGKRSIPFEAQNIFLSRVSQRKMRMRYYRSASSPSYRQADPFKGRRDRRCTNLSATMTFLTEMQRQQKHGLLAVILEAAAP